MKPQSDGGDVNESESPTSRISGKGNPQISSRRLHTGRVLNLDVDLVRFPNGTTGELEMIRHPGASAVLPFLTNAAGDDPQILLLRQYRYAADDFLYEIPAGRLESGELPIDCARRELKEETGCSAEKFTLLTTILTTPGFTDERIHLFMAEGLTMGTATPEADEFVEVETMALSKALTLIREGVLSDAKSALAILYAAGFTRG
jgi:ADP-ribose pyrophosphatase